MSEHALECYLIQWLKCATQANMHVNANATVALIYYKMLKEDEI